MFHNKRLVFLSLFILSLFSLLIVQFFKIQILEGKKWAKKAEAQHRLVVTEPFKRGLFYSNTSLKALHPQSSQALVIDVPKWHLFADPHQIPKECREEILIKLKALLGLTSTQKEKMHDHLNRRSRSRKLMGWLDKEQCETVHKWWIAYARSKKIVSNSLFFVPDYKRCYPFGKLLGQVLHTLREEKDEQTHQAIPTGGLEQIFDKVLQGKEGKTEHLRSVRHPLETGHILSYPENGADVYLTINHHLQAIAEEEIAIAVKKANAKGGWAIIMEPHTGEIWALAQYPFFDPADYRRFFNDPLLREHTKVKAVTDPYEPGSIMKPLTLALALKANEELKSQGRAPLFSPFEKIATSNGHFPGRKKPIADTSLHHFLNMYLALQKSSNIYAARLVQRIIDTLGAKWYRDKLQEVFGLGIKTGVELPSESQGLLPTPGKRNPNGTMEWSTPTPFSMAFGHNFLANSFQMARCYAILANGGYDVRPTIVRKIVRQGREGAEEILLDHTKSREQKRRLLEPHIVSEVVHAMKYVTKPNGCGTKADIPGYTEVAKSGTSEKIVNGTYSKKNHISSLAGFAPAKDPRFVLLVTIDEPEFKYIPGVGRNQFGGNCCGPAFSKIGLRVLQYLGVEPDDPYGYPIGDPRRNVQKADFAEETKALKELYEKWNR